jgi:hypothetical protein
MTPQHFLNLYEKIYKHDKDIGKFKEVALVLSIIFMLIGIVDNSISIYAFVQLFSLIIYLIKFIMSIFFYMI